MEKKQKRLKRKFAPILTASFPLVIAPGLLAKATDLSSANINSLFAKPLSLTKAHGKIALSETEYFENEFNVIWSKNIIEYKHLKYMPAFVRLKEKDIEYLVNATYKTNKLDINFIQSTKIAVKYLKRVKTEFDNFDELENDLARRINYVEEKKGEIFAFLDKHFTDVWKAIKDLSRQDQREYQRYYQFMLYYYLGTPSEINKRICEKPFGYDGDYVMMNYIYDNHKSHYLGNSSYGMLINNYTCNISISCSNILRKDHIKARIVETVNTTDKPKVLSIGSGPAREVIEILKENAVKRPFSFMALDFESRALRYVENEIDHIPSAKKIVEISYLQKDIRQLIKNNEIKNNDLDLIYVSGVFDYLGDKICLKVVKDLYALLKRGGRLIVCNISLENDFYRSYYELFGDWHMYHRSEMEVKNWVNSDYYANSKIDVIYCGNYLTMEIIKP